MAKKKTSKSKEKSPSVKIVASDAVKAESTVTMEELLKKYTGTPFALKRGDRVTGTVIEKEKKKIVVDIGGKGEGIVAEKAYQEARDYIKTLKVGDEVEAMVIVGETPDGYTILSLRNAMQDAVWAKLEDHMKKKTPLSVTVRNISSSGLTVDIEGLYGFIPTTQIGKELLSEVNNLSGKQVKAIIIDLNRSENRIVLSEKEVSEAEDIKLIAKAIEGVKEGDVYKAQVMVVANFGAFAAIDVKVGREKVPVEGLIHISEISWGKTENIRETIKVGDEVEVKVIGKKDGKLSFSMKQSKADPWDTISKKFKKDEKYKGTVTRVSDYGIFVALEEGIEGLIHITKIPPGTNLKVKDTVNVIVEEIDAENKKISLGLVLTAKPVGYK